MKPLAIMLLVAVLIVGGVTFWWMRDKDDPNGPNGANGEHGTQLPAPERLAELLAMHKRGVFAVQPVMTPVRRLFERRWYFDDIYNMLFVRTTKDAALAAAQLDKSNFDVGTTTAPYDAKSLDGWLAASASFFASIGSGLKMANRGQPRAYVLVLGLTAVVTLGILSRFLK